MKYPKKLARDPITEALLEIRFSSAVLPELLVGHLARGPAWNGFAATRLPGADIPASLRQVEPSLRYQPVLQLSSQDGSQVAKLGEQIFSWHALKQYPGWETFRPQLWSALDYLFAVDGFSVNRMGFKYINLLTAKDHGVESVNQLNLSVAIGGKTLEPPLNLNYRRSRGEGHDVTVRVASPEFVVGPKVEFTALIDIDVYTLGAPNIPTAEAAKDWTERAHDLLKEEFFPLLNPETIKALTEQ